MLRVVATVEGKAEPGQVMPLADSIGAAPSVTRAQAGPAVVPFPQYVKVIGVPAV